MNIIFFGSDDFALVNLEQLVKHGVRILACVTQPDRPSGRGLKVQESPIKIFAKKHGLEMLQPSDVKSESFAAQLTKFQADLFVVVAYGNILPARILEISSRGAVNVHGSLLPKYRGAAPINWAIINGEQETGVSIIQMNSQMDAGDILAQAKLPIEDSDTSVTLRTKMAKLGAETLVATLQKLEKDSLKAIPQNPSAVTFAPKLTKELGLIDWTKPAQEIHNLVRGLLPWPAASTFFQKKMIKILATDLAAVPAELSKPTPGTILKIQKDGLLVATRDAALLIKTIHPESGNPMPAQSFALGHRITPGAQFTG